MKVTYSYIHIIQRFIPIKTLALQPVEYLEFNHSWFLSGNVLFRMQ